MTIRERLIQGLLALGAEEIQTQSRKYRAFRSNVNGNHYFVGKAGALRFNTRPTITGAVAASTRNKQRILNAAAGQLKLEVTP